MAIPGRLAWKKPTLTSPTYKVIPVRGSGTNSVTKLDLSWSRDYVIKMPKAKRVGGIHLNGGRHIHMVSGYASPNPNRYSKQYDYGTSALLIQNLQGVCHIEGVAVDPSVGGQGDALHITDSPRGIVQVENCRFHTLSGINDDQVHGDVIQVSDADSPTNSYAALKELRVDRLTGITNGNGFWFDRFGPTKLKRVNLRYYRPASGIHPNGKLIRLCNPQCQTRGHYVQDVWIDPSIKSDDLNQVITPSPNGAYPCQSFIQEDGIVTFSGLPLTGEVKVNIGTPAHGDHVPSGVAGINYVSPGYF